MKDSTNVGLAEQAISRDPEDVLVAYGLGSCVGIIMVDPVTRVAGLLHAVLPRRLNGNGKSEADIHKFVEGGTERLIADLQRAGAEKARLTVRIVGGANMLLASGLTSSFDIGTRNIEAARTTLDRLRMPIAAAEVGGHLGRTVRVYVADSRVTVRVVGEQEREI